MSFRVCFPLAHNLRASTHTTLRSGIRHDALRNANSTSAHAFSRLALNANGTTQLAKFSTRSYSSAGNSGAAFTKAKSGMWYAYAGVAGLGLGAVVSTMPGNAFAQPVHCDARPSNAPAVDPQPLPPPPQSAVNMYELSFGTVAGLCAGIFVKKGAKIVGFFLGGVFVLLQYFASASLVRVDWTRMASRFENLFYTTDAQGVRRAPNVGSLLRWIIDFLTADFQQRATFIAGFALGLRVG